MIAKKTWRETRWMMLGYTLVLEILLVPAILLFPELRRQNRALEQLAPTKWLRDLARSIGDPDPDYAYRQYMMVQMFFKGVNIVGISAAVLLCTALVARERENRTLELLLSRPLSRTRILLAKFGVVAIALVVPIFVTSWSALPLSRLIDHELPLGPIMLASAHSSAFVLLFAALTCLCSVTCQTQAQTAFAVGSIIVVQAALFFVQKIEVASVFNLSHITIYGPILEGNYGWWGTFRLFTGWVLLAAGLLLGMAVFSFRRIRL